MLLLKRIHVVSVTKFEIRTSGQAGVILKLAVGLMRKLTHTSIRCYFKIGHILRNLVLNINNIMHLLLLIHIQAPGLLFQ